MNRVIQPTLVGRALLAFYKIRWILLPCAVLMSWLMLIVICELRIREEGLRKRMDIMAKLLTDKSVMDSDDRLKNVIDAGGGEIKAANGKTVEENTSELRNLLGQWHTLKDHDFPSGILKKLAAHLNPETNGLKAEPSVGIVSSTPERGDYREHGIDLRVNPSGDRTKKSVREDAEWYLRVQANYLDRSSGSRWFISDGATPLWPADEYRFYDYKRQRLNHMIIGGLAASMGTLALILGSRIGGFNPPSWKQILRTREFSLNSKGRSITPFNRDANILRLHNWGLWVTIVLIIIVQYFQCRERKELWAEGWINHPSSFLVILAFGMNLMASIPRLVPIDGDKYILKDYLEFFRHYCWCILCIPSAAVIIIVYSLVSLMPLDPNRAIAQTIIGLVFLGVASWSLYSMAKSASEIECRETKESTGKERILLKHHLKDLLLPQLDQTLPLQLLGILGAMLTIIAFGN